MKPYLSGVGQGRLGARALRGVHRGGPLAAGGAGRRREDEHPHRHAGTPAAAPGRVRRLRRVQPADSCAGRGEKTNN